MLDDLSGHNSDDFEQQIASLEQELQRLQTKKRQDAERRAEAERLAEEKRLEDERRAEVVRRREEAGKKEEARRKRKAAARAAARQKKYARLAKWRNTLTALEGKSGLVNGCFTEEFGGETFVFKQLSEHMCLNCTQKGRPCAVCLSGATKTCSSCRRRRTKCVWPEGAPHVRSASPSVEASPEPERDNTEMSTDSEDDAPPPKRRKVRAESSGNLPHAAEARAGPSSVAPLNDRGLLLASLTEMDDFISNHKEVQAMYESATQDLSRRHMKMKRSRDTLSSFKAREEAIVAKLAAKEASLRAPEMIPSDE